VEFCSQNKQDGLPEKLMYCCLIPNPTLDDKDVLNVPFQELNFTKDDIIGVGNFGKVYKGTLRGNLVVAIKELKSRSGKTAERKEEEFLLEKNITRHLSHPYIVTLMAFVQSSEHGNYLVQEYMEKGDLLTHLKDLKHNNPTIHLSHLLTWIDQVCSGMGYLAGKNIVHRDLAARNVLLDKFLRAKVADFGLSRVGSEDQIKNGEKIPIKWTAPEAFMEKKYSEKSDVWSFGVVIWEVFSFGGKPYATLKHSEYKSHINEGYRMTFPGMTVAKNEEESTTLKSMANIMQV